MPLVTDWTGFAKLASELGVSAPPISAFFVGSVCLLTMRFVDDPLARGLGYALCLAMMAVGIIFFVVASVMPKPPPKPKK